MTSETDFIVRVTGIRSQNPMGFGGAIFTGIPIDQAGAVLDASSYVVVKASQRALGPVRVERGQWWRVRGTATQRETIKDGYHLLEQQVDAVDVELARPSGEHIISFIASNPAFEGFGMVKARRLWEHFGEALYSHLDEQDAEALSTLLSPDAVRQLLLAWHKHGETRTLQWLQARGFDIRIGRKVLAFFGADAEERISEDPYRLLSFAGSWAEVDRLATGEFGIARDDDRRLRGAVEEGCYRALSRGHTAVLSGALSDAVAKLLGAPPPGVRWRDFLSRALTAGLEGGCFVQAGHGLQLVGAMVMERQVAKAFHQRLTQTAERSLATPDEVDTLIHSVFVKDGVELNSEQRRAIHVAASEPFACITGGAGVGKTTVLKALYHLYEERGVHIVQVALAGRAAKRMHEATGRPASTIASFLRTEQGPSLPDPCVLVIDEASMVDIISMSRVCDGMPSHVRFVLVGDPSQLMPVGPGLVLHSVGNVPSVPSVELKTVKRYGGKIAELAAAVRAGRWLELDSNEAGPAAFLPCEDSKIADLVVELYALDPENTQILSPLRNGPAGTKRLNELCQVRFTKDRPPVTCWNDEFQTEEVCGLREGDLVLCTRNIWSKGLQNGSLGRVTEVESVPRRMGVDEDNDLARALAWIEWDDGERRALTVDMLDDVELGYAITVHKAQGSQWQRVIVPVVNSQMLDRTLIYTAITRAQHQVMLVGDAQAAQSAVIAPPRSESRNVGLDIALAALIRENAVSK